MNSKLFDWYLKLTTEAEVQGGGIQLYVTTLEKTLLKFDFPEELNDVTEQRLMGKVSDKDVDDIIYKLYPLTNDEVDLIHSCKQVNRGLSRVDIHICVHP